jgi:hypothetical protein
MYMSAIAKLDASLDAPFPLSMDSEAIWLPVYLHILNFVCLSSTQFTAQLLVNT